MGWGCSPEYAKFWIFEIGPLLREIQPFLWNKVIAFINFFQFGGRWYALLTRCVGLKATSTPLCSNFHLCSKPLEKHFLLLFWVQGSYWIAQRTCTALDATSVCGNKTSAGRACLVSVAGTRVVVVNSAAQRTRKVLDVASMYNNMTSAGWAWLVSDGTTSLVCSFFVNIFGPSWYWKNQHIELFSYFKVMTQLYILPSVGHV